MGYVYSGILAVVAFFSYLREKNIYNPIFMFCGMWALVTFLASMHLTGLNEASFETYTLVFLGNVCFVVGALFRDRAGKPTIRGTGREYRLNYAFVIPFFTIVVIVTAILASRSISYILHGGSLAVIRNLYRDAEAGIVIDSNLWAVFENYVIQAAVFAGIALIPVAVSCRNGIGKAIVLVELLLLEFLYVFVSGARAFLFFVALLFVVHAFMNQNLRRKFAQAFRRTPKQLLVLVAVAGISTVAYTTTLRKGADRSYAYESYRYIALSVPLFDVRLSLVDDNHVFTHGWTLAHGFVKTPLILLKKFTGIPLPSGLTEAVTQISANNDYYWVGGGEVNSFVTIFYYMLMDFWIPGLVVEALLFGYFCQSGYKRLLADPNKRMQALYLLLSIGMLLSFVRLFLTAHRYVNALLIVFFSFIPARADPLRADAAPWPNRNHPP